MHAADQATSDLRECGGNFGPRVRVRPARDLADLGIGVALRLESQGADLLRLQGVESFAAANDPLAPGESIVWPGALRCDRVENVAVIVLIRTRNARGAEKSLPLTPHPKCFSLGDGLHPPNEGVALDRRSLGEQDFERALIRVLGVGGAD